MSPRDQKCPRHICGVPCWIPGPGTQKGVMTQMWPQRPGVASDSFKVTQKCGAEQGLAPPPAFPPCPVPHPQRPSDATSRAGHRGEPSLPSIPICAPSVWAPASTRLPAVRCPNTCHRPPAAPTWFAHQLNTLVFFTAMLRGASFMTSVPLLSGRGWEQGGRELGPGGGVTNQFLSGV